MNCPYCAEQIKADATVCKHCGRDLSLVRSLAEKLADAERQLEAAAGSAPLQATSAEVTADASPLPGIEPLSALCLTFILLVAAHYVIIVEFNLPLILLRTVSLLIPAVFGFLARESGRPTMARDIAFAVMVAILSVLTMSLIVGKIDRVPVLPSYAYEWREFAEYGASIATGYLTGVIGRLTVIATRSPTVPPNWMIAQISHAVTERLGGEKAGLNVKTVQFLVSTGTAAVSGITSIITGLGQFF